MDTSYLKLGNELYAVKRIECQDVDIDEELREFYQTRHDDHVKLLNESVVNGSTEEWTSQLDHLRKYKNRGEVTLPRSLYGKVVCYYGNVFLDQVRCIIYSPNIVSGPADRFMQMGIHFPEELGEVEIIETLEADITPRFAIPIMIGYSAQANHMVTLGTQLIHSFGPYGRICTGRHKASDFWNAANFADLINHINMYSPASHSVNTADGQIYRIPDLVNNDTVSNLRRRGDETWRTD